jgi:alkylation response protein AidB-like acyl-CoA dehydrogenase
MMDYDPPLRDIRFVLEELTGLDTILALPAFEAFECNDIAEILEHAARFATGDLAPLYRIGDTEGCRLENGSVRTPPGFPEAWTQFRAAGWCGATADPAHGGQGLPRLVGGALAEIWNAANMPFTLCTTLTESAATLLAEHGSETQQALYLPKLVSGEWTGAMAITEPQAGSDIGALTCRAEPDGDSYRLFGQKIFLSWGEHDFTDNIVHMVLARLPDAPPGNRGISLFLVPKFLPNEAGEPGARNDLRCVGLETKMGLHATPTCVMEYGGAEGAVGWLVGDPGKGLNAMFTMMNAARIAVGIEGLGLAERAFQQARDYARQRLQGRDPSSADGSSTPIIRHQDIRRTLLLIKARIEAMRALAAEAGLAADLARHHPGPEVRAMQEARLGVLTPLVKAWCTDGAVETASRALQVHGGAGYIEETGAAQILRDARITPIYEGTNGIQALDLVRRKLAGDGGRTIGAMIEEIRQFDGFLAETSHPEIAEIRGRLAEAGSALARATQFLLDCLTTDPETADAAASPYLDLLATVLGGYALARAAVLAAQHLEAAGDDTDFYSAKLSIAHIYATAILPHTGAREREIRDSTPLLATYPETLI